MREPSTTSPPTPDVPVTRLAPVAPSERIALLDVLRGFALLGILMVNMPLYDSPIYLQLSGVEWWTRPIDRIAEGLILFAAQGKFYPLFSLLFGVGLAIQLDRARARGRPFVGFAVRRLLVLLSIGLVHAFLIWFGDVLVFYAVAGLLLLPFRRLSDRALGAIGLALLAVPLVLTTGVTAAVELGRLDPETRALIDGAIGQVDADYTEALAAAKTIYTSGTYAEITAQRARDVLLLYGFAFFSGPTILGMFSIGFLLGRRRVFHDRDVFRRQLGRLVVPLAGVGLASNTLLLLAQRSMTSPVVPSLWGLVAQAALTLGGPTLCLTYVALIAQGLEHPRWGRLLRHLAAPGRMALTNYLAQSVACTLLFYGYGLGLFGAVRPWQGLGLTLLLWLLQVVASRAWLEHFRFGPVEWLWRSATYGRLQPLRRNPAMAASI